MILYQALSSYQILECMVHRQVFHREEPCVLLLGTYIKERMPMYWELETKGFFDEVYLFRFGGYRGTEEEIVKEVEEEWQRSIPYRISEFTEILAAGIHTYLELYFVKKGIPFAMFEDGSGALSRPWILADIHKKSTPGKYELLERHHLYDHQNSLITKKYCDFQAQEEGFFDEKAEDFPVMVQFAKLPESMQEEIRRLFDLPLLEEKGDRVLLLTQQFANLGQLSLDGQVAIYQHLFRYYLDGRKVLIKPHPDDILYYEELFPEAELIREVFPSELLPFAFAELPKTICTVSSTGVNAIRDKFAEEMVFNALYESSYVWDKVYLTALQVADRLGISDLYVQGGNQVQLANLAACRRELQGKFRILDNREELKGPFLILADDQGNQPGKVDEETLYQMAEQENAAGILFLNTGKQYRMYRWEWKDRFWNMIPIIVPADEADTEPHVLYFYPGKEEMRNMTDVWTREYTEDQIRIQMLEGILAATEKRLLEYIETEKELRQEITRLKMGVRK